MVEKIRKLIDENPDLGYRSLSDFVQDAIRRHPEYVEQFEHFNIHEDHVTIFDKYLKEIVDVYFQNERVYCDYHEAHECEHIDFVLTIPKVIEILEDKGWKITEGLVIRGPS